MMPGPRTTLLVPPKALQVPSHLRVQRQIARIEPLNLLQAGIGNLGKQRSPAHRTSAISTTVFVLAAVAA